MVIPVMSCINILPPQTGILGYGGQAPPHQRWKTLGDPLCLPPCTLTSLFIVYLRILVVIILGIQLQNSPVLYWLVWLIPN